MKKEIIDIDKKQGILRVTTADERWYVFPKKNKKTGLPEYEFIPSVTWIAGHYPKGVAFYKWLAQKGWDEAEALKSAAGDKGSKVHHAIEKLIVGKSLKHTDTFPNADGREEELTVEEWQALMSFVEFCKDKQPKFLKSEILVVGDGYAGTVDAVAEIGGETYIIDWKTSQYIWPEYQIQVSAYAEALKKQYPDAKRAILQIGYRRNKKKAYKFTEVEDRYELFQHARGIWRYESSNQSPKQIEMPMSLKLKKIK